MTASFIEKSVWVQLAGHVVWIGGYAAIAAPMLARGETEFAPFVGFFIVASIGYFAIQVIGHIIAALGEKPEKRDERDRQVLWRASHVSTPVVLVGVCAALLCTVLSISNAFVAHVLILALTLHEMARLSLRAYYYHRGL